MRFNITVHDAQVMHIEIDAGTVKGDFNTKRQWDFDGAFHMQRIKQIVVNKFVYNNDVGDRWTATH